MNKESLSKLSRLQAMDLVLRKLRAEADEKPLQIAHERRLLDETRARLAKAEAAVKDAQKAADRKELDLRSKEADVQKLEGQLNTATSNKVYSDLLLAIGAARADIARIEEAILVAMDAVEEREADLEKVRVEARSVEADFKEAEKGLAAAAAELNATHDQKMKLRDLLASEIEAEVLDVYERVRAIRKGIGLTEVDTDGESHFCTSCQMEVTIQDVSMALRGQKVVQCRSCQRILWVESIPTVGGAAGES